MPLETFVVRECSAFMNTICSYCPPGQVWSEIEFDCVRCGRCRAESQKQLVCMALDANKACMAEAVVEYEILVFEAEKQKGNKYKSDEEMGVKKAVVV